MYPHACGQPLLAPRRGQRLQPFDQSFRHILGVDAGSQVDCQAQQGCAVVGASERLQLPGPVAQHLLHNVGDQYGSSRHLDAQHPLNNPASIRFPGILRGQHTAHASNHHLHHPPPNFLRPPLEQRLYHMVPEFVPAQLLSSRLQNPLQGPRHLMLHHPLKDAATVLVRRDFHGLRRELFVNGGQRARRHNLQDLLNHMVAM
mmetsp:Transcript_47083/g.102402  ORF Transcript_47083/g.102402 Transcript_47083/m.102402 type:complete len:202 (+) Transcript_47083:669-1274(+)